MTVDVTSLVSDHLDVWTTAVERKSGGGRGGGKRINLFGIERLRALIFELAMRGKLVRQNSEDGDASALLRQVALEGVKSAPQTARRARKQIEPSDVTGPAYELPAGWVWVRLADISRVIRGVTYGKSDASDCAEEGKISLLRGHNIQSTINFDDLVFVPASKVSEDQILRKGDIVIAMSSGSSDLVGKGAPFTGDENVTFGAFCGVIRPFSEAIWSYLALFCRTPLYRMQTRKGGRGIGIQNLSKGDLEQLQCPLPPLAEQQRIVAKVDELMELCDVLEAESAEAMATHQSLVDALLATLTASTDAAELATNWARLEAHFDTLFTTEASVDALKQTILELAVRGKLVRQEKLNTWTECQLGEVISPMDSGWSPACHPFPARTAEVWGVLKTTAVQNLEYRSDQNKELPDNLTPRPDAECRVGDILITRAGPTNRVGICCYVNATRPRLMISDKIVRFRPASDQLDGAFLALALSVGPSAAQIEKAKSGMAASQVNISQAKLRQVMISFPHLDEQRQIVAKVDELMAFCDTLKSQIWDAANAQMHLADAIIERAAA